MSKDYFSVLVVNDPHISDYPPESRRDSFPDTPLSKVAQAVAYARKYNPDLTVFTGDHFHFKHAERTKYGTTRKYSELLKQIPGLRRTIIGNHDVPYDKPDRWVRQPLGYLIESGALEFFGGDYELNDEVFEKAGMKIRFWGMHYYKGQGANDLNQIKRGDEDYLVAVTHMDMFPRDTMSYSGAGVVHYEDVDSPADVILNGHIHDDMGIVQLGSTMFVNPGNLLRGSISESDLTRTPKVTFLIFSKEDGVKAFELKLNVAPAAEVFEVVRKDVRKSREKEMKEFVRIFGETEGSGSTFSLESYLSSLETLDPEVRRVTEEYIERAKATARS